MATKPHARQLPLGERLQRQATTWFVGKTLDEQRRNLPRRSRTKTKKPLSHRVWASVIIGFFGLAAIPAAIGVVEQANNPLWWVYLWIFGTPAIVALAYLANRLPESNWSRAHLTVAYALGYIAVPLLVLLFTNFNALVVIMAIVIDGLFFMSVIKFGKACVLHAEGLAA